MDAHANFAVSVVATAPSPASSGTTLSVSATHGARFPAVPFNATVCPADETPTLDNAEIVRVTDITGDVLTIVREQEGSDARTIGVGDLIAATVTAKTLEDVEDAISDHVADTSGAHAGTAISNTPAGNIAATTVQAAIDELDTDKAAATHVHAGEDITSGTVADARIASTIARDSEVTAAVAAEAVARDDAISAAIALLLDSAPGALDTLNELAAALGDDPAFATTVTNALATKQPLDSDLTAIAALTTTSFGRSLLEAANAGALRTLAGLVIGTDVTGQSAFDDHSARHEDGGADEISIAGLSGTPAALQAHLDDTSDVHDASAVSVADSGGNYTATDVEGVLAEIAPQLGGGGGGGAGAKLALWVFTK